MISQNSKTFDLHYHLQKWLMDVLSGDLVGWILIQPEILQVSLVNVSKDDTFYFDLTPFLGRFKGSLVVLQRDEKKWLQRSFSSSLRVAIASYLFLRLTRVESLRDTKRPSYDLSYKACMSFVAHLWTIECFNAHFHWETLGSFQLPGVDVQ